MTNKKTNKVVIFLIGQRARRTDVAISMSTDGARRSFAFKTTQLGYARDDVFDPLAA